MKYDTNCIFCKIVAGEIPATIVYESNHVLAFLDTNPIEKGHTLIIPKAHWQSILDIPVAECIDIERTEELMYIVRVAAKAVCMAFADGVNVFQATGACAGQTVNHLHFHIVPRCNTDGTPHVWKSGAGAYADNDEREDYANRISNAIEQIVKEEDLI